jgi:hypothetical protein
VNEERESEEEDCIDTKIIDRKRRKKNTISIILEERDKLDSIGRISLERRLSNQEFVYPRRNV